MQSYFVGRHVKVTGYIEEETAYNANEGGLMTSKAHGSVRDQAAVITGAGIHRAHYSNYIIPRLTMELQEGHRKGWSVMFRLSDISGMVGLEKDESS